MENRIFNRKLVDSEPASRNESEDESNEIQSRKQIGEEKYEKNMSIAGNFGKLKIHMNDEFI